MDWLVTGAFGFLGLELLAAIHRAQPQARILATDRSLPGRQEERFLAPLAPQLKVAALDVTDSKAVAALIARHRPAYVIHGAALTPSLLPCAKEAAAVMAVNLGGSLNVIRACLASPPRRLSLMSSAGVYMDHHPEGLPSQMRDESWPCLPQGPYAASKLALEQAAQVWGGDLDIICLRPGALYGPTEWLRDSRPRLSLPARMALAARSGTEFELAAPQSGRDWTHAVDAAEAIVALTVLQSLSHRVFNITSGERISNQNLAAHFAPHGLRWHITARMPERHESDQIPHCAARLQAATGLTPRYDLAKGVASLFG